MKREIWRETNQGGESEWEADEERDIEEKGDQEGGRQIEIERVGGRMMRRE